MIEKLLPCPFCGHAPEVYFHPRFTNAEYAHCSNMDCNIYSAEFLLEEWNQRAEETGENGESE